MLKAQVKAEAEVKAEDSQFEMLPKELWHLHHIHSLDNYFKILDRFVDNARRTLATIPDPGERERQREQYRRVIEYAVDLGCGVST